MHQRSESTSPMDPDENKNRLYTTSSQAWWGGTGDNAISPYFLGESTSSLSSLKQPSGASETKATKSQARGDDTNKEIQTSVLRHSDGNSNHEQQYATSIRPPTMGEYLTPPHLELIGNSIDYTPYPYSGSYYGGIMPGYRPQALVLSSVLGVQHARMSLPLEVTEEPVYVNAKQYHGILRRRQSRVKAELEKKLIKVRKPYLHESRHLHAIRRARGSGGRFLNTKRLNSAALNITSEKGTDILVSANPSNSLGSQSAPSNSSRNAGSSTGHNKARGPLVQDMHGTSVWDEQSIQRFSNCNVNVNSCYSYQQGFQM